MTNSYTGGFDLCFEVTEQVLSAFAAATLGGQEVFAAISLAAGGTSTLGYAHLLISDAGLTIDPNHSPGALLRARFRDSSVRLTTGALIGPLAGDMIVAAPFRLSPIMDDPQTGTTDVQMILLDLSLPADGAADEVTVQVIPDTATRDLLDTALAPFGLSFDGASRAIIAAIRAEIANRYGTVTLSGLGFPVTRGTDGSLPISIDPSSPPGQPRFGRLALATLPPDDAQDRPGVLCVLAGILATPPQPARPEDKTIASTALAQRASLVMSADAFHRQIFCPLIGQALATAGLNVPPPCGTDRDGFLQRIADSFRRGYIRVDAAGGQNGTGYSVSITLGATLELTLDQSGRLSPHVQVIGPDTDLDIDWWVYLLAAFLIGPITAAVDAAVRSIVDSVEDLLHRALVNALNGVMSTFRMILQNLVANLTSNLLLRDVAITPNGLFFQLWLSAPAPGRLNPILGLNVQEDVQDLGEIDHGTVKDATCTDGTYTYTDHRRWKTATITAVAQDLGDQVSFAWEINSRPVPQGTIGRPVTPDTGEAFFEATTYDGSALPQPARVQLVLALSGAQLTINHSPPDGNFQVFVRCTATNASGTTVYAAAQIYFVAHERRYEDQYYQDLQTCIQAALDKLGRGPTTWPPPDGDDPKALIGRIRDRLGPLIQRPDSLRTLSRAQMTEIVGLLQASGIQAAWLNRVQQEVRTISRLR